MNGAVSKSIILGLLAVVVGVPFLLRPATQGDAETTDARTLIILSPHNEQIRSEFAAAFNEHRREQGKPPVRFDWRISGGTSDLRRQVMSQFEAAARRGNADAGVGMDLFFGGGAYPHNKLAEGVTVKRGGEEVTVSTTVRPNLPDELIEDAFPKPRIGGQRLYHPDRKWFGAALSSFGIVYNHDVLSMLDLPEPKTWKDLTDPRYQGWVALADPAHSGSIAATYEAILRRHGWERGWQVLRRCFANARYFTASSSKVPVDVSSGEAAAGMCIDFYGRYQAGAVPERRVGYVDPKHMTATTPDPISLLRGAPHRELAEAFLAWTLTREAQRLWQRRVGAPGGPEQFELRRQPVRRDMYHEQERQYWTDPEIAPFENARAFPEGMPGFFGMVAGVSHAMAIDVHKPLTRAWAAIQRTPDDHPHKQKMLELFNAMPEALDVPWPKDLEDHWHDALKDPSHPDHERAKQVLSDFDAYLADRYFDADSGDQLLRDQVKWTNFFRDNYERIVELAGKS